MKTSDLDSRRRWKWNTKCLCLPASIGYLCGCSYGPLACSCTWNLWVVWLTFFTKLGILDFLCRVIRICASTYKDNLWRAVLSSTHLNQLMAHSHWNIRTFAFFITPSLHLPALWDCHSKTLLIWAFIYQRRSTFIETNSALRWFLDSTNQEYSCGCLFYHFRLLLLYCNRIHRGFWQLERR